VSHLWFIVQPVPMLTQADSIVPGVALEPDSRGGDCHCGFPLAKLTCRLIANLSAAAVPLDCSALRPITDP
jgi:hypothetical protein